MKRRISLSVCSVILVAALWGVGKANAQPPNPANGQNYKIVTDVPRVEVDSWLKTNMQNCGADTQYGRYRFVIGFSTGNYNTDPVEAIAMRRLAFSLLNNTFTAGDQVQAAAWEMDVWNCSPAITLTADTAGRQTFVNDVPYSPDAGSQGGHDIEKGLYDLLTSHVSATEAPHTAILLFTNSDESQSPSGTNIRLFGANNPLLISEIKQKGYRYPPERKSFQMKAGGRNLVVDVIGLFPNKLSPFAGTEQEARYPTFALNTWQPVADTPAPGEKLPNSTKQSTPPPPPKIPWILIAVLILIVIILLIIYYMRKPLIQRSRVIIKSGNKLFHRNPSGHIVYRIGLGKDRILPPLTSDSKWRMVQHENGEIAITDKEEEMPPVDGKPPAKMTELAKLSIEKNNTKKYILKVDACFGFHFNDIHPIAPPDKHNSRSLKIEPAESMFCMISDDNGKSIIRLELNYQKDISSRK